MARRQHLVLTIVLAFLVLFSVSFLFSSGATRLVHPTVVQVQDTPRTAESAGKPDAFQVEFGELPAGILEGGSIAPKLENATLKAELGRATWKFLHTMAARFPEKPTESDRLAFKSFMGLFARLYPCGDCAEHFRKVLAKNPPQLHDRNAVAGWLCYVHNIVNKRLKKPDFDCNNIGDFYDCGCGDKDKNKEKEGGEDKDKDKPKSAQAQLELEKP